MCASSSVKARGFLCDFITGSAAYVRNMNDVNTDICGYIRDGAGVFIDDSDLIWFWCRKSKPLFIDDAYNLQHVNDCISDYYHNVKVPSYFFYFFCAAKHWICKSESVKLHLALLPVAVLICSTFWIRFVFECSTRIRISPSFDCEKWCLVVLLLLMHCCDKCTLEMLAM